MPKRLHVWPVRSARLRRVAGPPLRLLHRPGLGGSRRPSGGSRRPIEGLGAVCDSCRGVQVALRDEGGRMAWNRGSRLSVAAAVLIVTLGTLVGIAQAAPAPPRPAGCNPEGRYVCISIEDVDEVSHSEGAPGSVGAIDRYTEYTVRVSNGGSFGPDQRLREGRLERPPGRRHGRGHPGTIRRSAGRVHPERPQHFVHVSFAEPRRLGRRDAPLLRANVDEHAGGGRDAAHGPRKLQGERERLGGSGISARHLLSARADEPRAGSRVLRVGLLRRRRRTWSWRRRPERATSPACSECRARSDSQPLSS